MGRSEWQRRICIKEGETPNKGTVPLFYPPHTHTLSPLDLFSPPRRSGVGLFGRTRVPVFTWLGGGKVPENETGGHLQGQRVRPLGLSGRRTGGSGEVAKRYDPETSDRGRTLGRWGVGVGVRTRDVVDGGFPRGEDGLVEWDRSRRGSPPTLPKLFLTGHGRDVGVMTLVVSSPAVGTCSGGPLPPRALGEVLYQRKRHKGGSKGTRALSPSPRGSLILA